MGDNNIFRLCKGTERPINVYILHHSILKSLFYIPSRDKRNEYSISERKAIKKHNNEIMTYARRIK